ncbi:hypothetical protein [Lancefieldella sp. Marseille-Q7238]|uniref:hypothetical protein n=1 Tax=Lancefieldella sp. Marseille-Q7238 TaxID=3022127 RepID=UPI0024A8D422|nr:hypothetical protein [Lancefieldella sp. Marseille-Q7238]
MVIDYEVLCDSLDISHEALLRGGKTFAREYVKLRRKQNGELTENQYLAIYMKASERRVGGSDQA